MNKEERKTVKEVIHSIDLHRSVVSNHLKHNASVGRSTLDDFEEGMGISISKLEYLLKVKNQNNA